MGSSYTWSPGLKDVGGERAKNQREFSSSLDSIRCVVSAAALGDGVLPATCLLEQYFTATSVLSCSRLVLSSVVSGRAAEQLHRGQDGQVPARAGRHPWVNPPLQLNGLLKQSLC